MPTHAPRRTSWFCRRISCEKHGLLDRTWEAVHRLVRSKIESRIAVYLNCRDCAIKSATLSRKQWNCPKWSWNSSRWFLIQPDTCELFRPQGTLQTCGLCRLLGHFSFEVRYFPNKKIFLHDFCFFGPEMFVGWAFFECLVCFEVKWNVSDKSVDVESCVMPGQPDQVWILVSHCGSERQNDSGCSHEQVGNVHTACRFGWSGFDHIPFYFLEANKSSFAFGLKWWIKMNKVREASELWNWLCFRRLRNVITDLFRKLKRDLFSLASFCKHKKNAGVGLTKSTEKEEMIQLFLVLFAFCSFTGVPFSVHRERKKQGASSSMTSRDEMNKGASTPLCHALGGGRKITTATTTI